MAWTPARTAAVVAALLVSATAIVLDLYGGELFWPGLVTEFAATLVAVILALEIEGRRERRTLERAASDSNENRSTEARKRLAALLRELKANQTSIHEVEEGLTLAALGLPLIINPQLLDRGWLANSERLGDLLTDYELMSDLAFFYSRLEELRWRVRHRTEAGGATSMDRMTRGLVEELKGEVADVLDRVRALEPQPEIREVFGSSVVWLRGAAAVAAAESSAPSVNVTDDAGAE